VTQEVRHGRSQNHNKDVGGEDPFLLYATPQVKSNDQKKTDNKRRRWTGGEQRNWDRSTGIATRPMRTSEVPACAFSLGREAEIERRRLNGDSPDPSLVQVGLEKEKKKRASI